MDRLWRAGTSATVREVLGNLQQERRIAYTTVMTVMDNLHRKGWLRRELEGRAWRYRPSADREEYTATLLAEALASTDNHEGALLRFVEGMSETDVNALDTALHQLRQGRRGTGCCWIRCGQRWCSGPGPRRRSSCCATPSPSR
ncbi:BlaI/MecI/CopY family transcriptional regulator [Actinophytocola sp.]|jgi:predicted transcriptional regulator|uniref:BlaI/MecI/CopY family transcriptional regulator n=1 Tax=Actinophytocola sp. TaxID=1872138 RepID=UPI0039C8B27A